MHDLEVVNHNETKAFTMNESFLIVNVNQFYEILPSLSLFFSNLEKFIQTIINFNNSIEISIILNGILKGQFK